MNTATKLAINAEKTTSKRVVYKSAEATGYLIENKIADKISSFGKPKKNKESRRNLHSTRKKAKNN